MNKYAITISAVMITLIGIIFLLWGGQVSSDYEVAVQGNTALASDGELSQIPLTDGSDLNREDLKTNSNKDDVDSSVHAPISLNPSNRMLTVRVVDQNDRPVKGAEVLYCSTLENPSTIGNLWRELNDRQSRELLGLTNDQGEILTPIQSNNLFSEGVSLSGWAILGAQTSSSHGVVSYSVTSGKDLALIQILPSDCIAVTVVDQNAQPVSGMNVVWYNSNISQLAYLAQRETNSQGVALFAGLQSIRGVGDVLGTSFGINGAFSKWPIQKLTARNLFSREIKLQVPMTGSIKVRLINKHGNLADKVSLAGIMAFPPNRAFIADSPTLESSLVDGSLTVWSEAGEMIFEPVEIGLMWNLGFFEGSWGSLLVDNMVVGPSKPGEQVVHDIYFDDDKYIDPTILILDPEGQPVIEASLLSSVELEGISFESSTFTDMTGHASVYVDSDTVVDGDSWDMQLFVPGTPWGWSGSVTVGLDLPNKGLPEEIRLTEIPLLVSGTVFDSNGDEFARRFFVIAKEQSGQLIYAQNYAARGSSHFELRSFEIPSVPMLLSVWENGSGHTPTIPISAGQAGVRVVMNKVEYIQFMLHGADTESIGKLVWGVIDSNDNYARVRFSLSSVTSVAFAVPPGRFRLVAQDVFNRILYEKEYTAEHTTSSKDSNRIINVNPNLVLTEYRIRVVQL